MDGASDSVWDSGVGEMGRAKGLLVTRAVL